MNSKTQIQTTFRVIFCRFAVISIFGVDFLITAQKSFAQHVSVSQHKLSVAEHFAADLNALSQRMKVAFVVEGQPLENQSDDMPLALRSALLQRGKVEDEVILGLGEYYDYSVVRKENVFLFTKKYTDLNDIPEVTPEECRLSVIAASHILAPFNPRIPPSDRTSDPLAAGIARLLTPEQNVRLSLSGLAVSSLSTAQREEVWRLALYFYVQRQAQEAEITTNFIEELLKQNPLFHWSEINGIVAFGYDFNPTTRPNPLFIPISQSNKVIVTPDGTIMTMSGQEIDGRHVSDRDPTDPITNNLQSAPVVEHPLTVTISQVINKLNTRNIGNLRCQVDSVIAAKRVMTIGTEEVSSSKMMNLLADIYGLRVIHKEDGSLLLTRPRELSVMEVTKLGEAICTQIPAPLLHALHTHIRRQKTASSQMSPTPPSFLAEDYRSTSQSMRTANIRQLRTLAEPKVRATHNKQLQFSKLGEAERNLFTLAQTVGPLADLCWLAERPIPPYIANFEHVVLTGGMYTSTNGEVRFSLFLSYLDPATGKLLKGVGFTNTRLPQ